MKKMLIAAAAVSLLLVACNDTSKEVTEATPITADVESALTSAQTTISAQLASILALPEQDLNVSITANNEQDPPVAIATVILLTNPEIADAKIEEAVAFIQQHLETIDGITVHKSSIMITNVEGDVLH
ncbi:hypothetical protein [Caryophanon latum]|uniref:Lipoprotein n=1 Tax=Caryophanon latum TaxID=33977 RepID=A0A1C0YAN0_9BACL|nr:hypothetical protein [Caryophanon latum]OCS84190.1 hypothetical protein A6K76_16065 [Caryophanon latum]